MKRRGNSSKMLERKINSELDKRIGQLIDRRMKGIDLEGRFKQMLTKSQRTNMNDFNRKFFGTVSERVSMIPLGSVSDSQFLNQLTKEIQTSLVRNF